MEHFLIATNSIKDENLILTSKIEGYISEHGGSCKRITGGMDSDIVYKLEDDEKFDCMIALGETVPY